MPTYDYKCNACGHEFELFQQMSDAVKRKCPTCGKPKLERLIGTGAGVLFKGGGFYETDYRSDSYTKAAEAEKKSAEAKPDDAKKPDSASAASDAKPKTESPNSEKKTSSSGDMAGSPPSEKNTSRKSIVKPAASSRTKKTNSRKR